MSWMKNGDDAATFPRLLEIAADPEADSRTLNEAAGWLWRCACQSAGHDTDYFISRGTAALMGGDRTPEMVRVCLEARLIEDARDADGMPGWLIIEDPDFIHIVKREEKEWAQQQREDSRDPRLKVPLLMRDGLLCRFCAVKTRLRGRPSNRTFTIHHLRPGAAATVDSAVVACMGCNSAIREDVDGTFRKSKPLMPPPRAPYLDNAAAEYLTGEGFPMSASTGPSPDVADAVEEVIERPGKSNSNEISQPVKKDCVGSGRDGAGRVGQGRSSPAPAVPRGEGIDQPLQHRKRRRGSRGGKGKGRTS